MAKASCGEGEREAHRGAQPLLDFGTPAAIAIFLSFAFAYFFSALLRAVTATLAPVFSAELGLSAGELGLLAGAYFLGFALPQLPLGAALDRVGPKRVLLAFLGVAVLACATFALARSFAALTLARMLIGVGVSACLMAPLTAYRHRFTFPAQMRANSWMLMTGSLGMVASTLPVQWLLPSIGWRGLFWAVAAALVLAAGLIAVAVSADEPVASTRRAAAGYGEIFRHPTFARLLPLGFFNYGGMIAVQSLWAGPWLTEVAGRTATDAARGLFGINVCMLFTFLGWGVVMPHALRHGWTAQRLIACGMPLSLVLIALAVALGRNAGAPLWAAWCVSSTFISLSQPAIGQAFASAQAGRALSAFNLVIFAGVFCVQWGIGLAIDALSAAGLAREPAYQGAFAIFAVCCLLSYAWFAWRKPPVAVVSAERR